MKKLLVVLAVMALASVLATFAYAEEHGDATENDDFAEHRDSDEHKASQCTAESRDGSYGCWVKCGEGKIASCEAGEDYQRGNCTCHDDPYGDDNR